MASAKGKRILPPMEAGQRYGRLVAIRFAEKSAHGRPRWLFLCDCGKEHVADAGNVRRGAAASCGCFRRETVRVPLKHGLVKAPEYNSWSQMRDRCSNPKNSDFHNYGGRGITVSLEWHDFRNFYQDMGPKPSSQHSLDRIDNDGNYEPGNCRWATAQEQRRNQSGIRMVTYAGRVMPLFEAIERSGLSPRAVHQRLFREWSEEEALTHPIGIRRKPAIPPKQG